MKTIGFHSITAVGHADQDPAVHYYETGSVRATFDLVVRSRNDDGALDYFPVEVWGKQAQLVADHVRKGASVGVIGSFRRNGETNPVYIRADHIEPLESTLFGTIG